MSKKRRVRRITDRRIGNQAAYEQQLSYELCDDLMRKSALRSGGSGAHYSLIVSALLCVRPISNGKKNCSFVTLLRDLYENDALLRKLLKKWDKLIYEYILARIMRQDYALQA